jgi:eukaryotic-like serine/threonine-protein kinase
MDNLQKLQELFNQCLDLEDPAAQQRFVEELRQSEDAQLLPQLLSLLAADRAQSSEAPVAAIPPVSLPSFGPYQADSILGRGGMGVVYLAHRADGQYEQSVAVKVISASLDPTVGQQQFLRERQILANLQHPGIAQLYDGGVNPDGSPYLVMEYVKGEALDAYCRNHKLSIAARIALIRKVCSIVAFAHRNLIIHRDLKPSNILVDAQGEPKLLDFGTARLMEQNASATNQSPTQTMLTPRYASPEQLRNRPVATSTDVFALGVMLAELLNGKWPFGDPLSKVDSLRRVLQDIDPTPLEGGLTAQHAEECSVSLQKLQEQLSGDIQAIVSKCLETNPEQRYKTVEELNEDLRRYLADEPVAARPATSLYRFQKFIRRHRLPVLAATLALLSVIGLTVYALVEERHARREADRAVTARLAFEQVMAGLNPTSTVADFAKGFKVGLARKELQAELRVDLLMAAAAASFTATDFAANIALLQQSAQEAEKAGDNFGQSLALAKLAMSLTQLGRMSESDAVGRRALTIRVPVGRAREAVDQTALGSILFNAAWGRSIPPDVERFIEQARALRPEDPFFQSGLTALYMNIAVIRGKQARDADEKAALETGLKCYRSFGGDSLILEAWRTRLLRAGDYAGAERFASERLDVVTKLFGPDHLMVGHAGLYLARVLAVLGRKQEALDQSLNSLRTYNLVGPQRGAPINWLLFTTLAFIYNESGRPKEAEPWALQALQLGRQMDATKDARVAESHLHLGYSLRLQSRFEEAAKELGLARNIYSAAEKAYVKRAQEAAEQLAMAVARDASPYAKHMR